MIINSTLQSIFSSDRRSDSEQNAELNLQLQKELRVAREEFQDNILEPQRIADMRARMLLARKYRAEEKFEQLKLEDMTVELRQYFNKYLPIKQKVIPLLISTAEHYRTIGYDNTCPLNVVLLHARPQDIDYTDIERQLENMETSIGNIVFRKWCDKEVEHNSAILNLHAIMANIPTLVLSPSYNHIKDEIRFSISLWEAQSDARPIIRTLFSIKCTDEQLKSSDGKKELREQILFVSTILSACARDSYMLLTQGASTTLPRVLSDNPSLLKKLLLPEYKWLKVFVLDEYKSLFKGLSDCKSSSGLLSVDQMAVLTKLAEDTSNTLSNMIKE